MALGCVCDKGHTYIQADIYHDWPVGAPVCPECHVEWLELQVSKGKIRKTEDSIAIEVYADEHGIGMFEESDDYETQHFCSDLRLDDVETFLQFMQGIIVAGVTKGWWPVAVSSK